MNRIISCLIITAISVNCMGQDKPTILTLQQVEFKDNALTKTLADLSKEEKCCFSKNDFYILDFFHSSLSHDEYYLSIDRFVIDDKIINSIRYYVVINDIVYFISDKVSDDIIKILPSKREYKFKNKDTLILVGDYYFLIWKTLSGHYHILLRTCGE